MVLLEIPRANEELINTNLIDHLYFLVAVLVGILYNILKNVHEAIIVSYMLSFNDVLSPQFIDVIHMCIHLTKYSRTVTVVWLYCNSSSSITVLFPLSKVWYMNE